MRIGDWIVDLDTGVLSNGEIRKTLTPKSAAVLRFLVENSGRLILSEELLERFWRGSISADNAVQKAISEIRRQLGDNPKDPRFIKTVTKRGYTFVADPMLADEDSLEHVSGNAQPKISRVLGTQRSMLFGLVALLAIFATFLVLNLSQEHRPSEILAPLTSIVVLPFDDMTANGDSAWLSDGLTESLTESLSRVQALQVIARTSAEAIKYQQADIATIGEQLNVGTVVEGSIRRENDQLRITVQLIRADTGTHIWSANYDETGGDILAIQAKVSQQITEAIRTELNLSEDFSWLQQVRYSTSDVRAYELVSKAIEREQTFTQQGFLDEISYGQQALAIDPNYAEAHIRIAWGHYFLWLYGFDARLELRAQSINEALVAFELNPMNGSVNNLLVETSMNDGDWQAAESRVMESLESTPLHGPLHNSYAYILASTGRFADASIQMRRANILDPNAFRLLPGVLRLMNGEFESAIEMFQRFLPAGRAMEQLLYAYYAAGRENEALNLLLTMISDSETVDEVKGSFEAHGFRAALRGGLENISQGRCNEKVIFLAIVQDEDSLFECIDKIIESKRSAYHLFNVHPAYKLYRDNPRFKNLLRKMNLAV